MWTISVFIHKFQKTLQKLTLKIDVFDCELENPKFYTLILNVPPDLYKHTGKQTAYQTVQQHLRGISLGDLLTNYT